MSAGARGVDPRRDARQAHPRKGVLRSLAQRPSREGVLGCRLARVGHVHFAVTRGEIRLLQALARGPVVVLDAHAAGSARAGVELELVLVVVLVAFARDRHAALAGGAERFVAPLVVLVLDREAAGPDFQGELA